MESRRKFRFALLATACIYFVTVMAVFSTAATRSPAKGHKVKVTGLIVLHEGDVVQILDGKDGSAHSFKVTDKTTIRCDKGLLHGSTIMNTSILVPALTVEVEGIGSSQGMPEAKTIRFNPDTFAFTAAQDNQGWDLCRKAAQDGGRSHGVRTLFSSLLPM
jgi:hypothetical protein